MKPKLLLIGCGKMGGALLERVPHGRSVCVVDPAKPPARLKSLPDVTWLARALTKSIRNFKPDIVIIAIKPQHMADVLPAYAQIPRQRFPFHRGRANFGASCQTLLGGDERFSIVRAMPNLPASIGQGAAVAVANKNVTGAQRALCDQVAQSRRCGGVD